MLRATPRAGRSSFFSFSLIHALYARSPPRPSPLSMLAAPCMHADLSPESEPHLGEEGKNRRTAVSALWVVWLLVLFAGRRGSHEQVLMVEWRRWCRMGVAQGPAPRWSPLVVPVRGSWLPSRSSPCVRTTVLLVLISGPCPGHRPHTSGSAQRLISAVGTGRPGGTQYEVPILWTPELGQVSSAWSRQGWMWAEVRSCTCCLLAPGGWRGISWALLAGPVALRALWHREPCGCAKWLTLRCTASRWLSCSPSLTPAPREATLVQELFLQGRLRESLCPGRRGPQCFPPEQPSQFQPELLWMHRPFPLEW